MKSHLTLIACLAIVTTASVYSHDVLHPNKPVPTMEIMAGQEIVAANYLPGARMVPLVNFTVTGNNSSLHSVDVFFDHTGSPPETLYIFSEGKVLLGVAATVPNMNKTTVILTNNQPVLSGGKINLWAAGDFPQTLVEDSSCRARIVSAWFGPSSGRSPDHQITDIGIIGPDQHLSPIAASWKMNTAPAVEVVQKSGKTETVECTFNLETKITGGNIPILGTNSFKVAATLNDKRGMIPCEIKSVTPDCTSSSINDGTSATFVVVAYVPKSMMKSGDYSFMLVGLNWGDTYQNWGLEEFKSGVIKVSI